MIGVKSGYELIICSNVEELTEELLRIRNKNIQVYGNVELYKMRKSIFSDGYTQLARLM